MRMPNGGLTEEEGEHGLQDFVDGVGEALNGIMKSLANITEAAEKATAKEEGHTAQLQTLTVELRSLGEKRSPEIASRLNSLNRQRADDMVEHASRLEAELPALRGARERLTANMTGFLSLTRVERIQLGDHEAHLKLTVTLMERVESLRGLLVSLRGAREACGLLGGFSQDVDGAITVMKRALGRLIDEIEIQESDVTRLVHVLGEHRQ